MKTSSVSIPAFNPVSLDSTARARFAHILFPTDFSPAAERALPYALEIARRYHATIHVANIRNQSGMYAAVPPEAWAQLEKLEAESRREYQRHLEQELIGTSHEILFGSGEIWSALSEIINSKKIDLIVLATHGPLPLERAVLGSVAEEVFRRAPCPVLTVGPSAPNKPKPLGEFSSILYATDFSAESLAGAPYAISLAREHRAQLILMHSRQNSEDLHKLRRALAEIVPFGAELPSSPDCVVERGRPAEKILEVAEAHEADLIVLGVRAAKNIALSRFVQRGSYYVVANAKCPVLTVRS